jgi:hypothetical protein
MSFRMQQYGIYQATVEVKHQQFTCLGHLRDQGHPTTTRRRCSANQVEAHMPRSGALDTKRYGEPVCLRKQREQLSTKLMCISRHLEQTS